MEATRKATPPRSADAAPAPRELPPHTGEPLLLVDNSNTRTKFALLRPGEREPGELRSCPTAEISAEALRHTLRGWEFARALVCSVAPAACELLRSQLPCPVGCLSAASCPQLLRGYGGADTLGADRIANAAALAALYPLPCVAVDPGTACTFDLVVAEPEGARFVGGAIAPGLHTAAAALAAHTACLPLLTPDELREEPAAGASGRSTKQAMLAGLRYGFCGMARGVLAEMSRPLAQQLHVVLTGGDADLLVAQLEQPTYHDNMLTLKGIIHIHQIGGAFF